MKSLVQYQIEVAICLAAFTLLYLILWRKETNFSFKRYLLLAIPLFSMIIPLINFSIDLGPEPKPSTVQYITYLPNQLDLVYTPIIEQAETISIWDVAFWIMCLGIFIMALRILISYMRILQIYRKSRPDRSGTFNVVDEPVHAFSFFKLIIINKLQAKSEARDYILAHEKAHQKQGHSLDILWLEIVKMFHWFNPMIWLLTNESKKNLEYLADLEVSKEMGNPKQYQYAIVQHASQSGYQLLKTQFSKTNLKKRIIMMNQPTNHKIATWKFIALIPVFIMLLMSFSIKVVNLDIKKELSEVLAELPSKSIVGEENVNPPISTINIIGEPVSEQDITTLTDGMTKVNGSDLETETGERGSLQSLMNPDQDDLKVPIHHQKIQSINMSPSQSSHWRLAMLDNSIKNSLQLDTLKEVFTIVEDQPKPSTGSMTSYYEELYKSLRYPEEAKENGIDGRVFVQFIVKSDGSLDQLKAVKGIGYGCDEEAIRVIKEGPGWVAGRQRGRAVNVRMIVPVQFIGPNKIVGKVMSEDNISIAGANVIIKGTTTGTVTDANGNFSLKVDEDHKEIVVAYVGYLPQSKSITPGNRYTFNLKIDPENPPDPASSIKEFNEDLFNIKFREKDKLSTPIFFVNGIEVESMQSVNPNDIKSIEVLKDAYAVEEYGEKAANGVVLITLKDGITFKPPKINSNIDFDKNPPLIIVDGVETELSDIQEEKFLKTIDKIQILKDTANTNKYGEKGKNGVIIIKTRDVPRQGSGKIKRQLQGYPIEGWVYNQKGEAIQNVIVGCKGCEPVRTDFQGRYKIMAPFDDDIEISAYSDGYLFNEIEASSYRTNEIVLRKIPYLEIKKIIDENGPQLKRKEDLGIGVTMTYHYDIVIRKDKVYTRPYEAPGNFEKFGQELIRQSISEKKAINLFGEAAKGGLSLVVMK